jgi:hypothetical protein
MILQLGKNRHGKKITNGKLGKNCHDEIAMEMKPGKVRPAGQLEQKNPARTAMTGQL